jgi:hypothetical protein
MNRLRVLQAVAEHGHLRCVDLAAACWPGARYGQQMAQRTVRVLIDAGDLKARANALGSGQSLGLGVRSLGLRVRSLVLIRDCGCASALAPRLR